VLVSVEPHRSPAGGRAALGHVLWQSFAKLLSHMPVAVFLVFLILGPPIGGGVLVIEMQVAGWLGLLSTRYGNLPPLSLDAFIAAAVLSYPVGGVQALFTAFVALNSLGRNSGTRVSLLSVLLACTAASITLLLLIGGARWIAGFGTLLFTSLHLGAAFGAWLISTMLLGIGGRKTTYGSMS
jgi:hypothetical protein